MKKINGYEGLYSIESDGRIWSHQRIITRKNGSKLPIKGGWLKPVIGKLGYVMFTLYSGDGGQKKVAQHRLMAEYFLMDSLHVNHKNGNRSDNRLENLEWVTPSQNAYHAKQVLKIGAACGERSWRARLTDEKVRAIRRLREEKKLLHKELGEMFNISQSVISRVLNNQTWTHVK